MKGNAKYIYHQKLTFEFVYTRVWTYFSLFPFRQTTQGCVNFSYSQMSLKLSNLRVFLPYSHQFGPNARGYWRLPQIGFTCIYLNQVANFSVLEAK